MTGYARRAAMFVPSTSSRAGQCLRIADGTKTPSPAEIAKYHKAKREKKRKRKAWPDPRVTGRGTWARRGMERVLTSELIPSQFKIFLTDRPEHELSKP